MKTAVKSSESDVYRRRLGIFSPKHRPLTHRPVRRSLGEGGNTSFVPLSPATPFSPPSGPTQWLFQGPPAESKFLAAKFLAALSLLFSALACGSLSGGESAEHTCRILFLDRPADAPATLHLFDGATSREVDMPGMNLSKVYVLPAGPLTLALLPEAIDSPEKLPEGAPAATVPDGAVDFYLIVTSDPENEVAPYSLRVIEFGAEELRRGQMLWVNLTDHTIRGKLGEQELLVEADSTAILDAPSEEADDYPVSISYRREDAAADKPVCETRWTHNPRARHLALVVGQSAHAPRIVVFPDMRAE